MKTHGEWWRKENGRLGGGAEAGLAPMSMMLSRRRDFRSPNRQRGGVEPPVLYQLPMWPLTMMIVAYPVWFMLGLSGVMWVLLAIPMAFALINRPGLVVPNGIGLWVLFIAAVLGSAMSIDTLSRAVGYTLRFGYYVGAGALLLYVLNGRRGVPVASVVRAFTILWMVTVAGGWAALVFGELSFRAPMYYLLPQSLLANDLISSWVSPGFADVQNIVGFPVPRPKAPYSYSNGWGSMLALLTPFAMIALADTKVSVSPRLVRVVLVSSVVPAVISLNRGLWISFAVAVVYLAIRSGAGGNTGLLLRFVAGLTGLGALILLTPLGDLIAARFATSHSNSDRTDLATAAIRGAFERPLFGWGAPRPSERNLPSVGTHGQLWMVAFSHGFLGLFAFLGTMGTFFARTFRQQSTAGLWAHCVVVVAIVQLPIYLMLPGQLYVVMAAVAVALRYQASDLGVRYG